MHSNTKGFNDVAGHYILLSYEVGSERHCASAHQTIESLAKAVFSLPRGGDGAYWGAPAERHVNLRALSPRGKPLDIGALYAFGERLARTRSRAWWLRKFTGYVRRQGPVEGTGRHHRGHFRRFAHINERRAAALVLVEEGERGPRLARNVKGIADPWDCEYYPWQTRNWKRQHKGRKSWDRPNLRDAND